MVSQNPINKKKNEEKLYVCMFGMYVVFMYVCIFVYVFCYIYVMYMLVCIYVILESYVNMYVLYECL